jgi:xylulokinase
MSAVLAVDLGGSALKACLFDTGGEEIAAAGMPITFEEDAGGRSEQHPQLWWEALGRATEEIAGKSAARLKDIAAVAICGFTRTQVFLDEQNNVVRPAIGFRDSRASGSAEEALSRPGVAGHPAAGKLNAFHPLARLLWLQQNEPKAWATTQLVLEPKDYLNLRLTGQAMSDLISQFWLRTAMEGGAGSLAALAGIDRDPLPPTGNPEDAVGHVLDGLPGALSRLAGAPVFCGSNDTWAAVGGLGALRSGYAYCISGSSEVLGLVTDRNAEADGLSTVPWGVNIWQVGGPGQNGANALAWIVDILDSRDLPFAERLDGLLKLPASSQPLLFHPFLQGERVPFWDRDLRASFFGLSAVHGAGDLVRAVMEGVAFVNRIVLERAEQATGQRASEVRIAGGGGRSPVWNQIRADILGRPVLASPEREMGLAGCLALARVGLAVDADMGSAADAVAPDFARFEPDPARRPRFDAYYSVFRDAHGALSDASHRLARIGRDEFDPASH